MMLLLLFSGCTGSKELHARKSISLQKKLLLTCQEIQTIHDLNDRRQELKKNIDLLTDQILVADTFYRENGLEPPLVDDYSVSLKHELQRIYTIPGARDIIERIQRENLIKLDSYAQSTFKR